VIAQHRRHRAVVGGSHFQDQLAAGFLQPDDPRTEYAPQGVVELLEPRRHLVTFPMLVDG
jgi:hypothetical protein